MGRDDADLVEDLVRGGVHAMGAQSLFQCSTNDSIALLSTFTELNVRSYSAGHRGVSGCWGFWDGCGVSA